MSQKTITILNVRPFGKGQVCEVGYSCAGKDAKAKAWTGDVEGKEGTDLSVEFEKKPGYNNGPEEVWIKVPKAGGRGGFGGGGKADPARQALEEKKHADFLKKWDKDRIAATNTRASIEAQVVLKAAVELAIASGNPDPNAVQGFANDLTITLAKTHEQIFASIAARSDGGQQ